jgi:hypothetical protein
MLNAASDELNSLIFRKIGHFDTSLFFSHLGSAVFAHIDLHEFVYIFVEAFKNFIRRFVTTIQMSLPMIKFNLFPHLEKKMNRCG